MDPKATQPQAGAGQPAQARPTGESIREGFMAKLARERGDTPPASQPPVTDEEREDDQPVMEASDEPVDGVDGLEDGDQEGEEGDELTQLRSEIERLSKREKELTADYTRKTQKIAETRRQLESDVDTVRQTARYIAETIDAPLRQFESVPWAQLQTQDPAKYQTLRAQFEQATVARNQFLQQLAQREAALQESIEVNKRRQAEVSREILKTQIPNWSNELYGELKSFVVENGFMSEQDFDGNVDHGVVLMAYRAYRAEQAANTVRAVKRQAEKNAPTVRNKQQLRSAQGQFQTARQALAQNRGDRNAARNFFTQKLAAERRLKGNG